ncbi:MAG: NACHT domain-containing protein [Caldilinea sp. CFX5]|nr:NACHT domain-containing protein [Caldilinea sp. CFX5]
MSTTSPSFGTLLRTLRKRVGMTQGDLAAAVGYSVAAISALEQERRLPAVEFVVQTLVPALALTDTPQLAKQLVELAAAARGERPPTAVTIQRTAQVVIQEEVVESPGRLPSLPTALIGRTAQVQQLCDRLLGHGGRLLTLMGPPGIGKTTLALAVASRLELHFKDGVRFIALAAITDPALVATTIANELKLLDVGRQSPEERLVRGLRRQELLLVLDNFEQIVAAAPLLATLLAECPRLALLVTSRERLHLRAEQRFVVPPLDLTAAVTLFVQRAQMVAATFALTPENQLTIEKICRRLDCLPLALELSAARIDLFSPQQMLAHLQTHALELLTDNAQDAPLHQRTLRRAIQASYALLAEHERVFFRTSGVFVDGFDLAAVAHVGFGVAELHGLMTKSLMHVAVQPTTTAPHQVAEQRFALLEMVREYALEELHSANEAPLVQRRHADYFLNLAATAAQYMDRRQKLPWLERLQADYGNLRAALAWLIATDPPAAQEMARWLWRFWEAKALLHEGCDWLSKALAADTRPTPQRAWALWAQALITDQVQAQALAQECLQIFQAHADAVGCCEALSLLGYILINLDQPAQALPYLEQSLALARDIGDPHCLAHGLVGVGDGYLALGRSPAQILPLLAESAQIYEELDDWQGLAYTYFAKGRTHVRTGDYSQGIALCQEALAIDRAMGSRLDVAYVQTVLGGAHWFAGKRAAACTYWEEARQFFQAADDKAMLQEVWYGFAMAARYLLAVAEVAFADQAFDDATRLCSVVQKILDNQPPFLVATASEKLQTMLDTLRRDSPQTTFAALWSEGQGWTLAEAVTHAATLPGASVPLDRPPWLSPAPDVATPAPRPSQPKLHPANLTAREVEVLRLLTQRLTYPQIAEKLIISRRTVNAHVTAIYSKLGVNGRESAIRFAADHHLL